MTGLLDVSPVPSPARPGADQRLDMQQIPGEGATTDKSTAPRHGVTRTPTRPSVVTAGTQRNLLNEFRHCAEWPPSVRPGTAGPRSGAGLYRIAHGHDPLELRNCRR
jgi:hypothetical protein